jgi:hypothetical protein
VIDIIKIDLTDEQRELTKKLLCKYLDRTNVMKKIQDLSNLLRKENCKETADILDDKTKCNELFLLDDKKSLLKTISLFERAINIDSKSNNDILKILKHGCLEEKKNGNITVQKVYGFFDLYTTFSDSDEAYKILQNMEVKVCPYCNRQYTYTVRKKDKNCIYKSRPQFDHFFPKFKYPYLSISIFNLVPSCGLCNQGKTNTSAHNFLYPYEESFEDKGIYFEISNLVNNLLEKEQIVVQLEPKKTHKDIINQYNKSFKTELLYSEHFDYISELLHKQCIFNEEAIESIYTTFDYMFDSSLKVKQLLLGYCEPENFNQRPLSKLTKDILQQLEDE